LEEKSDEVLRDLRIKTVQWSMIKGEIVSIKITLNDNSESPQFGTKEVDHSLDLPADRPVRYIKFHNDSFFLQSVQFLDDANKVIAEIKGHNSTGMWSLIKFGYSCQLIGIMALDDESHIRSLGFMAFTTKET